MQSGKPPRSLVSRRRLLRTAATLSAAVLLPASAKPHPSWSLIAHRGVYNAAIAENTRAAMEESIRYGYSMIEIDIRRSKDGRIIIQHDASFRRVFGVNRGVAELSWPEIRQLRSTPGDQPPLEFEELAEILRGRIGLWLDIKIDDPNPDFLARIERVLRESRLSSQSIIGINPVGTPFFRGRMKTVESIQSLFYSPAQTDLSRTAVLVEGLGFALSDESVRWGLERNIPVVPFIGSNHYPKTNPLPPGSAAIRRLQASGVTTFMIDSIFESSFLAPSLPTDPIKKDSQ